MNDVGYLTAFLAGILALLSPCSALLLPAFFAITFSSGRRILANTGLFYLGLVTTLVPLGAGASLLGSILLAERSTLILASGTLIILLGAFQFFGGGFDLERLLPRRLRASTRASTGRFGPALNSYVLGLLSGIIGFCTGPILGSVITLAVTSGKPVFGASLLAVYALGMALPLVCIALIWSRGNFSGRSWLSGKPVTLGRLRLHSTSMISGGLLIALGVVLIASNGFVATPELISPEAMSQLQTAAMTFASRIPDAVFIGIFALLALGAWWLISTKARSGKEAALEEGEGSADEHSGNKHRAED